MWAAWQTVSWAELSALMLSSVLLLGYWFWVTGRLSHGSHLRTIPNTNRQIRQAWMKTLGTAPGADILAVQTLRNAIMAGTVLASATVLTLLGLFTLIAHHDDLLRVLNSLMPNISVQNSLVESKLILLLVLQLLAFYSFLTSIRYYGHISFLVSMPVDQRHIQGQEDVLPRYLQRAGDAYSIGQRLFLFTVPMFAWLLGSSAMLGATIVLLLVMYLTDRY